MEKKIFSSLLWILVAIVLFWTIINLTKNKNLLSSDWNEIITWKKRERLNQSSIANMSNITSNATWEKTKIFMMNDIARQLWMTPEEIKEVLSDGKTMEELIEENWITIEQKTWHRNSIKWTRNNFKIKTLEDTSTWWIEQKLTGEAKL